MSASVTGETGLIGKRLARRLMQRDNDLVYVLVYRSTPELSAGLKEFWGADADRVTLIEGDISKPDFGVSAKDARKLEAKIDQETQGARRAESGCSELRSFPEG